MEAGTVQIPPYAFKVLHLQSASAIIYGVIYGFSIGGEKCFFGSLKGISDITDLSRNYVCNVLNDLIKKGYIRKTYNTIKNRFEYRIVPIEEIELQPEKQEKPKRKTKQKTAANTAKIITDCETVENASNPITDDENAVKTQENANKPPDFELTADKPIMQPENNDALSVVKPKKNVISTINADTLISQFHIDPQTAHDFLAVRKAKKAPLTLRALQGINREAEKINLTLAQVLHICIERNWQGFQAHWLIKERNEILQAMTPEQKAEENKKAGQYIDKVLDALITKGTISKDDYYKFGDIFMKKFNECFSVNESYQVMMNAINEKIQQQTAIGA